MNRSVEDLQYRMLKTLVSILARIPRHVIVRLAEPLGRFWHGVDAYHRKIAFDNMTIAFGRELKPCAIRRLVKSNFIHLTRVTLELPSLLKLNGKNVASHVAIEGRHHLEQALAGGTGILLLTGHLGNWELMALAGSLEFNLALNILVRPLDFTPMDRLLTEIRTLTGNRMLDKDKSAAMVGRMLKNNEVVGILLDQNSSWYEGVYVPFFGRTVCTNKGLALLARRYGAAVLPAFNVRQPDGRYRIIIDAPVKLVRSKDAARDMAENTHRFNQIIEKYIRMAPDNWFWVHRRFRIKGVPEKAQKRIGQFDYLG